MEMKGIEIIAANIKTKIKIKDEKFLILKDLISNIGL